MNCCYLLFANLRILQNSTIVWELRVLGWEVSYGAEFTPDAEGGYTVIVQKTRKVPANEEPIMKGSFKVGEPGKLVLTINNPASKKKKLLYRSKVKSTSEWGRGLLGPTVTWPTVHLSMIEERRNLLVWFVNLLGLLIFGSHSIFCLVIDQSELVFVIVAGKKYYDIVMDGCWGGLGRKNCEGLGNVCSFVDVSVHCISGFSLISWYVKFRSTCLIIIQSMLLCMLLLFMSLSLLMERCLLSLDIRDLYAPTISMLICCNKWDVLKVTSCSIHNVQVMDSQKLLLWSYPDGCT